MEGGGTPKSLPRGTKERETYILRNLTENNKNINHKNINNYYCSYYIIMLTHLEIYKKKAASHLSFVSYDCPTGLRLDLKSVTCTCWGERERNRERETLRFVRKW